MQASNDEQESQAQAWLFHLIGHGEPSGCNRFALLQSAILVGTAQTMIALPKRDEGGPGLGLKKVIASVQRLIGSGARVDVSAEPAA